MTAHLTCHTENGAIPMSMRRLTFVFEKGKRDREQSCSAQDLRIPPDPTKVVLRDFEQAHNFRYGR